MDGRGGTRECESGRMDGEGDGGGVRADLRPEATPGGVAGKGMDRRTC